MKNVKTLYTFQTKSSSFRNIGVMLLLFFFFGLTHAQAGAVDYYVKTGGNGTGTGTSFANAFGTLQQALSVASFGSKIYVAKGTYKPTQKYNFSSGNIDPIAIARFASFKIPDGVEVHGGFAGTEIGPITPAVLNARDFITNLTTLSGDIDGSVDNVTGTFPNLVYNNYTGNAYHVVYTKSVSAATKVSGFTIKGGNANVVTNGNGAGWYNNGYGAGGLSNPSLSNIIFSQNKASNGGGMYNYGQAGTSSPSLVNCTFSQNNATNGGGMLNYGLFGISSPSLVNCTFSQNNANNEGGGMANFGTGGTSNTTQITNSIFWDNTATNGKSWYNNSATPNVSYSLVEEADQATITTGNYAGTTTTGGNNIYNQNPLFTSAATGDLTLQAGSPALNVGNNAAINATGVTTDLAGNARIQGTTVDMGAYERAVTVPEINVQGSGTNIVKGQTIPVVGNDTEFGNVARTTNKVVTYTIQNTGTADLTISSIGTNASDFVVSGISFPATIAASGSTTFKVTFTPSTTALRKATITINNNDADEAAYDFAVQGTGTSAFVTTWITTDGSITIPSTTGVYNYAVTWKNLATNATGSATAQTGNYTITGLTNGDTYEVAITGVFPHFYMSNAVINPPKLKTIQAWGNIAWTTMENAFYGCSNLTYTATDVPNLSNVTNMSNMFTGCINFNGNIGNWTTTTITNMFNMFGQCASFNGNIGSWDTKNVTQMKSMLTGTSVFNQNISTWDTRKVTNMESMFSDASVFNQNISTWNTANVTNMDRMFNSAFAFNQNISTWNTSKVTSMRRMFQSASIFNQDISIWNTSAVTDMYGMFQSASAFNQNISIWNTSAVTNMYAIFANALSFNQNIGNWDISKVTDISYMFSAASVFNQNLSTWNTSAVTKMDGVFRDASAFNQNIGSWDVTNVTTMLQMLNNSGLNTANYDATLIGWAAKNVKTNVTLGATNLKYCTATTARTTLVSTKGWTITGDALLCLTSPEINLQGNNVSISSGSTATSTGNNTDFGQTIGTPISKPFVIQNTGVANLSISSITSSNSQFVVSNLPSSVSASTQQNFTVTFTPTVSGVQTSTITIANNDSDESSYTFVVKGEGICPVTPSITASTATVLSNQVGSVSLNSQLGVIYQLQNASNGNSNVGNPIAGTGSMIYLQTNLLTTATDFRVVAIRGLDCGNQISNTVTINVSTLVLAYGYNQTELNTCTPSSTVADIDVLLTGGSYSWSNSTNNQDLSNVTNGIYSLTIDGTTTLPVIVGNPVTWESPLNATINGGKITANGVYDYNVAAAARSASKLAVNETGGFTFLVEDMATISDFMIGLAQQNNVSSYTSIKNSFYITPSGTVYVYWNNGNSGLVTSAVVQVGDRLTMTREGQSIKYYHNATLLYTDTQVSNSELLVVDIALTKGTSPQVWFSKCTPTTGLEVMYQQTAFDDCATPAKEGSISLLPQGGIAPYTYVWSNGIAAVSNPSSLETGVVVAQVSDAYSSVSLPVIIGNPIEWSALQNVSQIGNILYASASASNFNSGAISAMGSASGVDAGITFIYNSAQTDYMVGLSAYNTNTNWTSLGYSVSVYGNTCVVYESGTIVNSFVGVDNGDRITIVRQGSFIVYYVNNTEVHRTSVSSASVLYADISIWKGSSPVVYSSFCTQKTSTLALSYTQTLLDDCATPTGEGSINLQATGGNGTYSYTWTGGLTNNPRTSLQTGLYQVSVASGTDVFVSPVVVGANVEWSNLTSNTTQTNGTLTATGSFNWTTPAGGLSTNRLAANTDGGISYIVPSLSGVSNYQIGLSSPSAISSNWSELGYSVFIDNVGKLYIYESGYNVNVTGTVVAGDRISILRRSGNIEYYINSKLVYSTYNVTMELAADISLIAGTSPSVVASFCTNPIVRIATKVKSSQDETTFEEDAFKIYPNPSTGVFKVRFSTVLSETTQVTIFDGIGRKVSSQTFEKGSKDFTVNLTSSSKGMYLIHFNQNGAIYSKSIIVE